MGTGVAAPNGWLKQYAASIGAAEVTSLAVNGWFSHEILNALRNDARFRTSVERADVIALNAGMNEFFTGRDLYTRAECGPDGEACLRHMVARFNTNWDAIIGEIRALAPRAPVVVLTLYHPLVAYDDYYGWAEAVNQHMGAMNWHMASTGGIAIADVHRAYNGATGMDDPIAKGYILPDAIHATDAGHAVIADLVRALDVRAAPADAREAARIVGPDTGSGGER
jgi:lysophospholipase L1-like esterase